MKKIELLAPAGNIEAFRAAVENGADAIYLGGSMFSARQYADNFQIPELTDAVNYAHTRNVKVYVTVNTLVLNREMKELVNFLYEVAQTNVDAFIVQDLGVAGLIRRLLPEIELHASTQMAVHNSSGVNFLEKMGFTRAVLAREVSLENIKEIRKNSSLELETFVHGALCIAYSGQCLLSSMIGGRSGNRGRCAQPCRMKYSLVDNKGNELAGVENVGEYLLSPKDLKMIEHIPELIEAGISSLKIEGRMKRPEYVAIVVRNYRKAIDSYYFDPEKFVITKETNKELEQIFNRQFTTGHYFHNQGRDLMSYQRPDNRGLFLGKVLGKKTGLIKIKLHEPLSVGDGYEVWTKQGRNIAGEVKEIYYRGKKINHVSSGKEIELKVAGNPQIGDLVYKTLDNKLMESARGTYSQPPKEDKIGLNIRVVLRKDYPLKVTAIDEEGYEYSCSSDFLVEEAKKHPVNEDILRKQFSRLGNTPFQLVSLKSDIKGELMVPVSELNHLRRALVAGLINKRQEKFIKIIPDKQEYLRDAGEIFTAVFHSLEKKKKEILLSVLVGDPESFREAVNSGADLIYLNWEGLRNAPGFTWESLGDCLQYGHRFNKKVILRIPRFVPELKLKNIKRFLLKARALDFDGILVGNLGMLELAENLGWKNIYADYTLNIFNDLTIYELAKKGIVQATLSPELNLAQIKDFSMQEKLPLETIIHGNFPLMVSEYCAVGSIVGNKTSQKKCSQPCRRQEYGLKDRMNFVFPLMMDENCRMLIYNAKPLNLYKDLKDILQSGISVLRIEGRKENPIWINRVTKVYREALDNWNKDKEYLPKDECVNMLDALEPKGYTTGHFYRGVQ